MSMSLLSRWSRRKTRKRLNLWSKLCRYFCGEFIEISRYLYMILLNRWTRWIDVSLLLAIFTVHSSERSMNARISGLTDSLALWLCEYYEYSEWTWFSCRDCGRNISGTSRDLSTAMLEELLLQNGVNSAFAAAFTQVGYCSKYRQLNQSLMEITSVHVYIASCL